MKFLQQASARVYFTALFTLCIAAAPLTLLARTHAKPKPAATQQSQAAAPASTQPSAAPRASDAQAAPSNLPTANAATPKPGAINVPMPPAPSLSAKSWALMDFATGQMLGDNNADERVEPASITKVMTAYVVSAELAAGKIKLDDQVFISENAWRGGGAGTDGSTSFLAVNSKVALKDLMYGMIIQSGNDAAIALAEHIAGSEQTFAELMNQYAIKLGMTGTHYVNASGLPDPNHYSTAHDIALLSRAVIHDFPEEYKIYAIKEFEWNGITQHNRNTLLWRDGSVDGIKTGHTKEAGFCLATSAKRGDQRLIAVVMGAPSEKQRADDNQSLLNYGFRFYESHKLYDAGKPLAQPELWKGAQNAPCARRRRRSAGNPAARTLQRPEGQHGSAQPPDRALHEGPESRHRAGRARRQGLAGTPAGCPDRRARSRLLGPHVRRYHAVVQG